MRRLGLCAEAFEILGWAEIAKGPVGSLVVVAVGEGVDGGLQFFDTGRQVISGVELLAPAGLGALDATVEVGTFGRQDDEFEALLAGSYHAT